MKRAGGFDVEQVFFVQKKNNSPLDPSFFSFDASPVLSFLPFSYFCFMIKYVSALLFLAAQVFLSAQTPTLYKTESGSVAFTSDAPLELIEAASDRLRGVIDLEKKQFAFSVAMKSFEGFNSPLQQEHFNENYLETATFPTATFTGKIIDAIDVQNPGTYPVRTKGKLTVHGVTRERIIKGILTIGKDKVSVQADFSVLLQEHDIEIPKIVQQKIAEKINLSLTAELLPDA